MDLFERKGHPSELLESAAENFNEMLGYDDRLGEMIADACAKQRSIQTLAP